MKPSICADGSAIVISRGVSQSNGSNSKTWIARLKKVCGTNFFNFRMVAGRVGIWSRYLHVLTCTVLISVAAPRPVSPHQSMGLAPAAGHGLEPHAQCSSSASRSMLAFGLPFLAGKAYLGGSVADFVGRGGMCGLSEGRCYAEVRVGPAFGGGARMALQGAAAVEKKPGGYQRWWDPAWRAVRLAEAKNPERQFGKEHLEMAELMGVTPEV